MVLRPSDFSACPSPALAGQVVWSVFWPLLLLLDGVLVGSLVLHSVVLASWRPSPSVVLTWVSSVGVCSGLVGRLRSCLGSSLL